MWDLMENCWEYAPEDQPTSQEIHDYFVGLDIKDNRPKVPMSSASEPHKPHEVDRLITRMSHEEAQLMADLLSIVHFWAAIPWLKL